MTTNSSPHVFSPLWVISLFLGLSEITVTIAVTQADGWVQGLLAIFAVVFPLLVSGVFFLILWHNNKILYAPREFAEGTTVREFAEAMARRTRSEAGIVQTAIRASSESLAGQLSVLGADEAQKNQIIESLAAAARRTTVRVELDRVSTGSKDLEIAVDNTTTVSDLLDSVYYAIADKVGAYSYGSQWILIRAENGEALENMGTIWARTQGHRARDYRPLKDVGIEAGSQLVADRLTSTR